MDESVIVSGAVQDVIFHNDENGYAVLTMLDADGEEVTVVGSIPAAAPGEFLRVYGVWEQHPKHGRQVRVERLERRLPEDKEGIFSFLSSGVCGKIRERTAKKIVDRYGEKTLEVLESQDAEEKLNQIKGLTLKKAREIVKSFRESMGLRRLMEFLGFYKISPILAVRLRERYSDGAANLIRKNPYVLSGEDFGVSFTILDRMALDLNIPPDSPERMEAALLYELNYNQNNGHVFLPAGKLIGATARLLNCEDILISQALENLTRRGEIKREFIAGEDACYPRRMYEAEIFVCAKINILLSRDLINKINLDLNNKNIDNKIKFKLNNIDNNIIENIIKEIENSRGMVYAPKQREAIEMAAREGVMILTGGPGTGKTTTVHGIAAFFQRMGLTVELCAPTGRAAQRLSEVTGMEARTIHRALGMNWDKVTREIIFAKSESEPFAADAVIADEMSMVDLILFSALLKALRPGTRLILVGDADQLPSVGAGNVFSDLIRGGRVPTVFLRDIFRQAEQSAIVRNAHAVNMGEPPILSNQKQSDFFFLSRKNPSEAAREIVNLCRTRLPERLGISPEKIQVLTPTRKGPCGTENLNLLLQNALNPDFNNNNLNNNLNNLAYKREIRWGSRVFREGDRVMQIRNDYDIIWKRVKDKTSGTGIFNGDVGYIAEIDPSGKWLTIDFDGREAAYALEMLSEIELAYAITVHKSQGSEYPCVILAATPAAPALMARGVLYTALTRARELFIAVGDGDILGAMARNDKKQRRYSGLRWRLTHEN